VFLIVFKTRIDTIWIRDYTGLALDICFRLERYHMYYSARCHNRSKVLTQIVLCITPVEHTILGDPPEFALIYTEV
jgi:hypothetical protein